LEESQTETVEEEKKDAPKLSAPMPSRRVLADGTYATESAFSMKSVGLSKLEAVKAAPKPPLRALLLSGDYFVGTSLASALTKLVLRYSQLKPNSKKANSLRSEAMLILTSIIRVGKSEFPASQIDEDSLERISHCLKVLSGFMVKDLKDVFLVDTRKAFTQLSQAEERKQKSAKDTKKIVKIQADDLISFRHLRSKKGQSGAGDEVRYIYFSLWLFGV
jgi:coatomer subunit beta